MPSIAVTCKCGEQFNVDERYLGQVITCWKCKRPMRPRHRVRTPSQYVHVAQRALSLRDRVTAIRERLGRAIRHSWPFAQPWIERRPVVFYLAIASWFLLAGVAAVAVVLPTLGDRWIPATVLLYAGRWTYLVPAVGLGLLSLAVWRPLLVPNLLSVGIVLGPIMGFQLGLRSWFPAPSGEPLRIVTLNAGGGSVVAPELVALMDLWKPDILAFQECGPALQAVIRTIPRWHSHDANPLCLLSRFPIKDAQSMNRDDLERVRGAERTGAGGAGYVTRYVLETPAGLLGVTNLHLETARKGLESVAEGDPDLTRLRDNMDIREMEARRARAFADGGVIPMLIVGDFNAPPESRNLRDSFGDLTNAFDRLGSGFGYTRYNGWIRLRIDHVFSSTGVRPIRARVAGDVGSDHRPVIVDYRVLDRTSER
ncbi:MAG: endonuclease/exonuclease/phosphatase family protein [Gemmatimonadetes bacterium]|nr:endonuclease/exonuclease/phosphatase family protein [Gemmatimonadota bacterium]